jgi:aminotransferase EvaB
VSTVPFGDLAKANIQYSSIIGEIFTSGTFVGGKYVENFESALACYLDINHVVSVASGTDALLLALLSLELPDKSSVWVVDNAGGYGSVAALNAGLIPIFKDANSRDFQIDIENFAKTTDLPSAVIITHLYGISADIEAIVSWGSKHGVKIVEDCAQAIGASVRDKKLGTFGDVACFSFYPTKNLGGIGDGGAIATNNKQVAEVIRKRKQYGWSNRYFSEVSGGINSRLDAINAGILLAKLPKLDSSNQRRREIYAEYFATDVNSSFFPKINIDSSFVAHLAVGKSEDPEQFISYFAERGVEVARHYPFQDSVQPGLNYKSPKVNNQTSSFLCQSVVSIPLYPEMTDVQVLQVCDTLTSWFAKDE